MNNVRLTETLKLVMQYTNSQILNLEKKVSIALDKIVQESQNLFENKLIEFQGDQGIQGIQGDQGIQGEQGKPFTFDDFSSTQLLSLVGPKGEQGERGEVGFVGEQGKRGEKGNSFIYEDFTKEQLSSLKGDKGDIGPRGHQGDKGDIGPQGEHASLDNLSKLDEEIIKNVVGEVITPDSLSKTLAEFRNDVVTRLSNMVTTDVISTHAGGGEVNFLNLDDIAEAIENEESTEAQIELTLIYNSETKKLEFTVPSDYGSLGDDE